jgi:hypothetical protein
MSDLDKHTRDEIIRYVLTLLDLIPEKDIEILEGLLREEKEITLSQVRVLTGISGPSFEALAGFLRHSSRWREILLVALQTGRAIKKHVLHNTDKCSLIWTGPIQFPVPARSTGSIIREMIDEAEATVTIVGYRLEEYAEQIIESLNIAVRRGVKVRLVIDRAQKQLPFLKTIWKMEELPPIYTRKIKDDDPMASIHAKIVIVDSSDLLVTSANLTFHGLHSNLEIGVRIVGKTASDAERLVNEIIRSGHLELV